MSLAGANDTRFRNKMRISRKIGSSVDGCRRARNSLGQLGKILGKNRNWPSVLCGKCGNRKICPRFHIGGESSGANGCNFPQMPRLPHSKTCSVLVNIRISNKSVAVCFLSSFCDRGASMQAGKRKQPEARDSKKIEKQKVKIPVS